MVAIYFVNQINMRYFIHTTMIRYVLLYDFFESVYSLRLT